MKTCVQPLEQTRFGVAQIGVGDSDVLESKLNAPCADLLREFGQPNRRR
jgi:hypothetical protein